MPNFKCSSQSTQLEISDLPLKHGVVRDARMGEQEAMWQRPQRERVCGCVLMGVDMNAGGESTQYI